ncbi:MAG TPA: DNA primase [Thermoanaerobaculia bacterium]|nr:DNA primase [Thermoanaerobaculia bacterium]
MALGNIHLTPQLVQAVRDAVDILAIASEHTRLRKAGRRYQGLCPIHKEKTPSFSVDPVQGLFYCFGCGSGGDAIKLHMLATGDDFPGAIEALATRYGVPLPTRNEARFAGGRPERDIEGALRAAAEFFTDQLRKAPLPQGYLAKRRIPGELIERFGLGYAPEGWRNLVQALHPRISLADLEAAGLVARPERGGDPYDRFRNRLMFPIRTASGRLVGFGGRTLGDDAAKYINTNETEQFHKGNLLYGLDLAKREVRESGRAVLVEGYFDVIGAVACGLEGAVAGMGTALTPEQAKLLSRYAEEVVVAYDGDNAGENAFRRALPLLLAEGLGARRARFGEGHDPDSLRLEQGEAAVAAAVDAAEDAVVAELHRLIPPEAPREPPVQAKAASAVADLLRPIPDAVLRFGYARLGAERLGLPVEMLGRRIGGQGGQQAGGGRDGRDGRREGDRSAAQPGGPSPQARRPVPRAPRETRNVEEQVLQYLLQGEGTVPPLEELPSPGWFFDTECRNIYQAYSDLYARGAGAPPDARAVLAELGSQGATVDRVAEILLEESFDPRTHGLRESLEKLKRRWIGQRRQEIQRRIHEAVRSGDEALANRLTDEKRDLDRQYYGATRPGAGG